MLASSSSWSAAFKTDFLGSTDGFYLLPTDSEQLRTLAWEIDQVRVVFDQDVTISQDDMILTRGRIRPRPSHCRDSFNPARWRPGQLMRSPLTNCC